MTGTDFCHLSVFNSFIITVGNVGVTSLGSHAQMVLFPNPNNGSFTVKGKTTYSELTMEIINSVGQIVYRKPVIADNGVINEQVHPDANLVRGLYMLSVRTGNENIVFRFVVE